MGRGAAGKGTHRAGKSSVAGGGPRTSRLVGGLAPAVVLALLSFWAGTFQGAASAAGAIVVHAVVLAAALSAAAAWREPLGLGRRGRFLTAAVVLVVAASAWSSPVSRAGWTAALLLPAWLLLPAAVRRAWRGRTGRRFGLPALSAVVLALSLNALVGRFVVGDARASMPLGHHNLLAVWLLALLPLALLPLVDPDRRLPARLLAAAAGVAGLAALLATGSLSGALGLATLVLLAAVVGAVTDRRRRRMATALGLLAVGTVAVALPRLLAVFTGADLSTAARWTYWEAGLSGALERPLLGWGPGAVPWTVQEWLVPVPGINPPYQVVGDLHSLPLHLLYEVGVTGLVLVVAVASLFGWRRLVALPGAAERGGDPRLVGAGLLGLAGAGVASLAVAPLAVPAVALALAVAAGAALAGEGMETLPGHSEPRGWWGPAAVGLPVLVYVVAAGLLLARLDRAHLLYDRSLPAGAGVAVPATALEDLAEAVRLDPRFPLYRMHLARESWPTGTGLDVRLGGAVAAAEALQAAEDGWGVGALWLSAGDLALAAGEGWASIALERACDLDPLGAAAPYLLARQVAGPSSARPAARSLLADPRLAAATYFEARRGLLDDAVTTAARWPGVAPGWGAALQQAVTWVPGPPPADRRADVAWLRVWVDRTAEDSLALYAFRRSPRPVALTTIPVRAVRAARMDLPAATMLPETEARAFDERGCRAGG